MLLDKVAALPDSALEPLGSHKILSVCSHALVLGNGLVSPQGVNNVRKFLKQRSSVTTMVVRSNDWKRVGALVNVKPDLLRFNSETTQKTIRASLADDAVLFPLVGQARVQCIFCRGSSDRQHAVCQG